MVISIIALLISLLLPSLSAAKESARRVTCLSQMRQINLATSLFATDHLEYLPMRSEHAGLWWNYFGFFSDYPSLPQKEWMISSLWPVNASGQGGLSYITEKKMILCPSRFDHYQTANPAEMIAAGGWKNFNSTYHAVGISGFMYPAGQFNWHSPVYLVRKESHDPRQTMFTDMMRDPSGPLGDWPHLKQSNHSNGISPYGGNVVRADGSGSWIRYNPPYVNWFRGDGTQWVWEDGTNVLVPNSPGSVWNVYQWSSTDNWKYYYLSNTNALRGKVYFPP